MLNPIGLGRQYQGYTQANQSLLEEDEEEAELGSRRFKGKQPERRSWDAGASEMNVLRPNIHSQDKMHSRDSEDEDDEVPQSFMIEASTSPKQRKHRSSRSSGSRAGPVLPTHTPVSIPPRPSDIDNGQDDDPPILREERQHTQMRGLDAYERALWNWVNVYNLDAFLQEVYWYYEGKGIYSIALARGLNLLCVYIEPLFQ